MITPRVKFEKQFGQGVDPWYAKAERWANKQKFPISILLKGLISFLKGKWIETNIENAMNSVDADIERIHELWDEEETTHRMDVIAQNGNDGLHYSQEPSEVEGLDNFEIRNNMFEED